MKHVFFINSHTTFLTAMGVVEYQKLKKEEILLVLVRNYRNEMIKKYHFVDWSDLNLFSETIFANKYSVSIVRRIIKDVDAKINSIFGNCYHLYAPHLAHPLWQIAYTSLFCKRFSYIQEGMIPFTTAFVTSPKPFGMIKNWYMKIISLNRVWIYRPWFLKTEIRDFSKVDAYAINNKFFKHLPLPVHIVNWPEPNIKVKSVFEKEHTIFVFDAYVKNGVMKSDDYLCMCKKMIDLNSSLYNYLKFHPGQSANEIKAIIDYFNVNKLRYEILDNNVPLEYIITKNKGLHLAGYGSSLLFLAYDYGHNVTCHDEELIQFPLYRKYRKNCGFMSFAEYTKS